MILNAFDTLAESLLTGILNLVNFIINIITTPIDTIINNYLPGVSSVISSINTFFDTLISYARFVISYTGITSTNISIIVSLFTFILTVPLAIHAVKTGIKWWGALH